MTPVPCLGHLGCSWDQLTILATNLHISHNELYSDWPSKNGFYQPQCQEIPVTSMFDPLSSVLAAMIQSQLSSSYSECTLYIEVGFSCLSCLHWWGERTEKARCYCLQGNLHFLLHCQSSFRVVLNEQWKLPVGCFLTDGITGEQWSNIVPEGYCFPIVLAWQLFPWPMKMLQPACQCFKTLVVCWSMAAYTQAFHTPSLRCRVVGLCCHTRNKRVHTGARH